MLPAVLNVVGPPAGAVHENQIEWPPALPAWVGSPASLVAVVFVPLQHPVAPYSGCGEAKASFVAPAATLQLSVTLPLAPANPSTATW